MVKYSFAQLEKKYNGFFNGRCEIDIDGFSLLPKFNIRGLSVQLPTPARLSPITAAKAGLLMPAKLQTTVFLPRLSKRM